MAVFIGILCKSRLGYCLSGLCDGGENMLIAAAKRPWENLVLRLRNGGNRIGGTDRLGKRFSSSLVSSG